MSSAQEQAGVRRMETGGGYLIRFGISQDPFGKGAISVNGWSSKGRKAVAEHLLWSLKHPGLYVLTGDSGVGKTTALRLAAAGLEAHRQHLVYVENNHGGVNDIYRAVACALNLEAAFRRFALWREIKENIRKRSEQNDQQTILVVDDAHGLPRGFLDSLAGFMNFLFDSRDLLTVWLVGDSRVVGTLNHAPRSRTEAAEAGANARKQDDLGGGIAELC
jgi:type II secretory pathway predicted ATPase ExeA